jgi:hypothetical protein
MTRALETAIERLRQMPEEQQDSIAKLLLHEIDEDERWARTTAAHEGKLQQLVDDILEADGRGECEPLNPETL